MFSKGLLERVRTEESEVLQLHQLVRDHCIRERYRDDQKRFRNIHRRIALALSNRREVVAAMRHAVMGEDPFLAG